MTRPSVIRKSFLLIALGASLGGCVWHFNAWNGPQPAEAPPPVVQFVAFGDAGTGSARQAALGRAMARVCADRGCDLALELGDNFYPNGVSGADDPQFQTAFEKPYELFNVPVYAVLGNHDNSTDGGAGNNNARGDLQLKYQSRKWRMPARYYAFGAPLEAAEPFVEFFALDSSPLAATQSDPDPEWNPQTYGARQLAWLKSAVQDSNAPWKIAFAHHPYVSNGQHGDATAAWKTLIEQGVCAQHIDLYLSAHDHDLEWLKPVAACGRTQFIVSGAGAPEKVRAFGEGHNPVFWHMDKTAGFFWVRLENNRMTIAAFTLDDKDALPANALSHPVPAYEQSVQRLP